MSAMQSPQSTGLLLGWSFRILLLALSVSCFLGTIANTFDRRQFSVHGIPATIERALDSQKAPSNWSDYKGNQRSGFEVKVKTADGKDFFANLFLTREVVDGLLDGQQKQIIFVKDNPRRFLVKGEPFPSFGLWWLLGGGLFFALFMYSLKLR